MDVREKLVELSDIQVLQREMECVKRKSATNCSDCLNCDLLMTDERILSAYKNAIDALRNAHGVTVQEWISVKDRLPELHTKVLCCGVKGGRFIAETSELGEGHLYWTKRDGKGCSEVTHWMPLPQPPKGE